MKLNDAVTRYSKSLEKTAGLFEDARARHLGGKDEAQPSDVAPIVLKVDQQFYDLHNERMKIVTEMVSTLQ